MKVILVILLMALLQAKESTAEAQVGANVFALTIFSQFMGNSSQFNCNVTSNTSFLALGEDICIPTTIKQRLNGTILLFEELGKLHKSTVGCAIETKYENAMRLGVAAVVSVSSDLEPGKGYYIHSAGAKVNYGNVPLLEVGSGFGKKYPESISVGADYRSWEMQILGCADYNPYIFWLNQATLPLIAIEVMLWTYGIYRTVNAIASVCKAVRTPTSVEGLSILYFIFLGPLGFQGRYTHSVLGDLTINLYVKELHWSGFAGLGLWSTIVIALLWKEVRVANKFARVPRDVLKIRSNQVLLLVLLVLLSGTDVYYGYLLANYVYVPRGAAAGIFGTGNLLIALYFWCQVKQLTRDIRKTQAQAQSSAAESGGNEPLTQFTKHLAYWLRIYSACVFVQSAAVSVVASFELPSATVLARVLLGMPKLLMSIAKVNGLSKAKRSRVAMSTSTRKVTSVNQGRGGGTRDVMQKNSSKFAPVEISSQIQ